MALCDCGITDVYYGGTEAQWAKIEIGYDNVSLTNATIHYTPAPAIGEVETEATSEAVTVSVTAENLPAENKVVSVGLNADGEVIDVAEVIDGSAKLDKNTKTVKIFVWESLESMVPLCPAAEKEV